MTALVLLAACDEKAPDFDFTCLVSEAAVGAEFTMFCSSETDGLIFEVQSSSLVGATYEFDHVWVRRELELTDIGFHQIVIKATHASMGSFTKTFTVSVDEHRSFLKECSAYGKRYLLPERTVDRLASCVPGYNSASKPDIYSESEYVLELNDFACAVTVLEAAPSEENGSWDSYGIMSPFDIIDACGSWGAAELEYYSAR